MSIKDNLEKAAALFGDSHEPKCVAMAEETKAKILKGGKEQMHEAIADMFERNAVVAKKLFDISEHEFLESDIQGAEVIGEMLRLHLMSQDLPYVEHSKPDAIAIAKALGVTGEDLL